MDGTHNTATMPVEALTAPVAVTLTGNFAAAVRFLAHCEGRLPEEFVLESVEGSIVARLSPCVVTLRGTTQRLKDWLYEDDGVTPAPRILEAAKGGQAS
jgi:hypothetical protein